MGSSTVGDRDYNANRDRARIARGGSALAPTTVRSCMSWLSRRLPLVAALALRSSTSAATPPSPSPYLQEVVDWRAQRETRLRSDNGWLTVVGLSWLHEGANTFGSAPENEIRLPASTPARAGTIEFHENKARYVLSAGATATIADSPAPAEGPLQIDADGTPTVLQLGSVGFHVIKRGERYGVRVKDRESDALKKFTGLEWYEALDTARVVARFVPHDQPQTIGITNVLGQVEQLPSPGYAEFTLAGHKLRLDPVIEEPGAEELFYIFRDLTSGRTTYGAGRFLYSAMPKDGTVVLDFNKAYSPPCAFTRFATCPLPPARNRLDVAVEAGERFLGRH
jgi:uncharacterized protein